MHNAVIRRIGVDAENRYLVTCSDDKSVRVLEILTNRLVKILRPPLGEGNEGKIYALAITPDGKTIACGGWVGWDWDGSMNVYILDRETGMVKKRITGLPDTIKHIGYSKDGRFLVVSLAQTNGIRVYRTSDYSLIAEDRDYNGDIYGFDFDRNGRLATASYDGSVRLYDENFRLIAKKATTGGRESYTVSFSPDSSKLAVGYADSTKVDVLSGYDLSYLYSPDTTGATYDLSAVTWSYDGRFLYAGGRYILNDITYIRKWSDGGRGRYTDLQAAGSTIMQILPLKNGGIVYGTFDPAFGIFNAYDRKVVYNQPQIANYWGGLRMFLTSYDGSTIQFYYEKWGSSPARFSIQNRFLETALRTQSSETLSAPVTYAEGLNITDWEATSNHKLNGKSLKIDRYELARSVAISPDRRHILLGAEWYLRLFDTYGNEKWKVAVPGIAWVVNISGNGRLAIAALGDGTIRWYRIEDGKELLALFPHNDRKRWVMWTPSGYYDASPGADEIIGWHRNTAKKRQRISFPYPSSGRHITGLM